MTTTFNVTAHTERFSFSTDGTATSRLPVAGARVLVFGREVAGPLRGSVQLGEATDVVVERVSTGPLVLHLGARRPGTPAGELFDEHDEPAGSLGGDVTLVIDSLADRAAKGENVVFPFAGRASVGDEVRFKTGMGAPLLRDGTVTLMGRTALRDRRFDAGAAQLATGDRLRTDPPLTPAVGFVVADEQPGLTVVLQVRANHLRVDRVGGEGFELSTSCLEALVADPALRPVWGAMIVIFPLTFWFYEWRKEHAENKR